MSSRRDGLEVGADVVVRLAGDPVDGMVEHPGRQPFGELGRGPPRSPRPSASGRLPIISFGVTFAIWQATVAIRRPIPRTPVSASAVRAAVEVGAGEADDVAEVRIVGDRVGPSSCPGGTRPYRLPPCPCPRRPWLLAPLPVLLLSGPSPSRPAFASLVGLGGGGGGLRASSADGDSWARDSPSWWVRALATERPRARGAFRSAGRGRREGRVLLSASAPRVAPKAGPSPADGSLGLGAPGRTPGARSGRRARASRTR